MWQSSMSMQSEPMAREEKKQDGMFSWSRGFSTMDHHQVCQGIQVEGRRLTRVNADLSQEPLTA